MVNEHSFTNARLLRWMEWLVLTCLLVTKIISAETNHSTTVQAEHLSGVVTNPSVSALDQQAIYSTKE